MNASAQEVVTKTVIEKVETLFPWLELLTAEEVQVFYTDLFEAIEKSLHSGDWSGVQTTIEDWQATAEVATDPTLAATLKQPIEAGDWNDWERVRAGLQDQD